MIYITIWLAVIVLGGTVGLVARELRVTSDYLRVIAQEVSDIEYTIRSRD